MTPDPELLRQFAKTNSQDAFAELVKRHVNLVYSAALRQVNGDEHFAKDVAQTVFTDLARKANALSRRETLTGWLYTSAHFAAAKIVRTEDRRRDREEKFMREPIHETVPEADWEKIRPTLDAAMHELKETDREAILLRYFENRQFIQIGAKLGLNENAARMRVERALEKLRDIFAKRGVTTATALASVISANAIQIAPANLAATLTTTSIATAGTGTFTLLKIMTATKLKLVFSAIVVAGAATAFVVQQQTQNKLRGENESLTQQITQLQTDNESLSNRLAVVGDAKSLSDEQFIELLKLRGEVGRLRQLQNRESVYLKTNRTSPESILQEAPTNSLQVLITTSFVTAPDATVESIMKDFSAPEVPTDAGSKEFRDLIAKYPDAKILNSPRVISANGMEADMSVSRSASVHGTNASVGIDMDVTPYFSTNSSIFNLNLIAKLNQLTGDPSDPDLQTIQVTNQLTLPLGDTAVLQQKIPGDDWLPDSTNTPTGPRSLLMFVTPTVVDDRGNLLNFPPPNQ
jgi:RNA polymerase sigma factor (sigma-70 family)